MSDGNQVNASLDEDATSASEEDENEGGGFSTKKLLLIVVIPLLLIGGGVGAYFAGVFDGMLAGDEETAEESHDDHSEEGEHGAATAAAFVKIPDMIVNLSSNDGQPRYLRLSVQLELETEIDVAAVEQVMPRVIDQFQTYLRELRVQDLRGSAGIYRLQMELLSRVNAAAYPVEVQDVLFQEILIQ